MAHFNDSLPKAQWGQALNHMQSALKILEETEAPGDVAPHLDLAMSRLEQALGRNPADNSGQSLHEQIDKAFAAVMAEGAKKPPALVWT
jgi:hypothetical protein